MPLTPHVLVHDLLPRATRDAIFQALSTAPERFGAGGTTVGLRLDGRRTHVTGDVAAILGDALLDSFCGSLSAAFRQARPQLGMEHLEVEDLEVQASVYLDGGFYQAHRDIGPNNTRSVTWLYYLHREPRPFTGGELVLYDTASDGSYEQEGALTLEPTDNSLLLFLSEYFHEVKPVRSASGEFADARFALNGWLHSSQAPQVQTR